MQVLWTNRRPGIEKIVAEVASKYPNWSQARVLAEAKNLWTARNKS